MAVKQNNNDKPSGTQSLLRGLQLIEILSNYPNGCPLAHLSDLSGLNKSTTYRLLQGLIAYKYVVPTQISGHYRLTTKLISVGQKALTSLNVIHIASPHLADLNLETGETINFSCLENDHIVLIYKLEPTTGMMRTRAYIGQHSPLYCTAMGKIYMAYGDPENVEQYWSKNKENILQLTNNTITDLKEMYAELKDIKTNGIAYDREENEIGVSCIAAPVFDFHKNIGYAVSISLSTSRLKQIGKDKLIKSLQKTAKDISEELGYQQGL